MSRLCGQLREITRGLAPMPCPMALDPGETMCQICLLRKTNENKKAVAEQQKEAAVARTESVPQSHTPGADLEEGSLGFVFDNTDEDVDDQVIRLARDWHQDVVDEKSGAIVYASEIRKAIIYHGFHNYEDTWWRERMSRAIIMNRPADFVARVPVMWRASKFWVPNPDCTVCGGDGQLPHRSDGEDRGGRCLCGREVFDLPKLRALQKDFNAVAGSRQRGAQEKARAVYAKFKKYFIKRKDV